MQHAITDLRWKTRRIRPVSCMLLALLLLAIAARADATPIYRCIDAHGHPAYQDIPCARHTRQSKFDLHRLPTIGDPAEVAASRARLHSVRDRHAVRHAGRPHRARRRVRAKTRMSWECRADDGEVFYRHSRCPGSVAGDGVVRGRYAESMSTRYPRSRHDAWSRVRVHGVRIPRAVACRRIHAAGAAGRDGHQRDATVSTYDHLMGRDPCNDP
jgi:hypothetical protein